MYTTLTVRFSSDGSAYIQSFENMLDALNIGDYYGSLEEMPQLLQERIRLLSCLKVASLTKPPQHITDVGSRVTETLFWVEYPLGETHEKES